MNLLRKDVFWFAALVIGVPDFVNDIIQHFDNCPMCNEELKSMFISENASKRIDSKHIQHIVA